MYLYQDVAIICTRGLALIGKDISIQFMVSTSCGGRNQLCFGWPFVWFCFRRLRHNIQDLFHLYGCPLISRGKLRHEVMLDKRTLD